METIKTGTCPDWCERDHAVHGPSHIGGDKRSVDGGNRNVWTRAIIDLIGTRKVSLDGLNDSSLVHLAIDARDARRLADLLDMLAGADAAEVHGLADAIRANASLADA